jgi:hypothetical protein
MSPNKIPYGAPIDRRPYESLTPHQRYNLDQSIKVVRMMRHGSSIDEACKFVGVSRRVVLKSVPSALKKIGKTWLARDTDRIPRPPMAIFEGGERKWIYVDDSQTASLIGRYHSYRGIFLDKLDPAIMEPFKNVVIKDMYGNAYTLDTDPELIFESERKREGPEPYEVYKYGG